MTKKVHFVAAILATMLMCSVAGAQARGGISPARIPSVRVAPSGRPTTVVPRTIRQSRFIQVSPAGQVTSGFSSFNNSPSFGTANGVPGLGFDYVHLAAISGGLPNGQSPNSGRGMHRHQGAIVPILVGGYPYYDYGVVNEDSSDYGQPQPQSQQQQPQVIVIQVPVPSSQQVVDSGNGIAPSEPPPAPAHVRDVGEFVLLRRDGRVLFASAFSVTGTQLTYVTPEGIRRAIPLADLDADGTQQMNEARGSSIQIHN